MSAVTFDTLAYVRKLEAAGVPRPQAEAQADAFSAALSEGVATRADVERLENRVESAKTALMSEIELAKRDLTIRLGAMIGAGVAFLAATKFFGH